MNAGDKHAVPGVYTEAQASGTGPVANPVPGSDDTDAWLQGYRYALLNPDDPGVQADLARYQEEQRERLVDQLQEELAKAEAECKRLAKGWEQAYQQGWRQGQDQRLEWRRQRDKAEAIAAQRGEALDDMERRLGEALADRDHQRGKQRELVRMLEEVTAGRDRAREQAAECMREVAQLHRQLDSLGTNPDRLAEQVGAGMAVELFGRVYVARDGRPQLGLATNAELVSELETRHRLGHDHPQYRTVGEGPTAAAEDGSLPVWLGQGAYASTELLEAQAGVFVPLPKGHRLEVSVTPWDDVPAEDQPDPPEHVCSTLCHKAGCPGTA